MPKVLLRSPLACRASLCLASTRSGPGGVPWLSRRSPNLLPELGVEARCRQLAAAPVTLLRKWSVPRRGVCAIASASIAMPSSPEPSPPGNLVTFLLSWGWQLGMVFAACICLTNWQAVRNAFFEVHVTWVLLESLLTEHLQEILVCFCRLCNSLGASRKATFWR